MDFCFTLSLLFRDLVKETVFFVYNVIQVTFELEYPIQKLFKVLGVSLFAQIEIEIADRDYSLVLVSFQMNKNIF